MIHARGELEASESLSQAAERLEAHPAALQLRTLSTLAEIAVEKNSTIVFPLPFEIMRVFEAMAHRLETAATVPVPPTPNGARDLGAAAPASTPTSPSPPIVDDRPPRH